MSVTADLLESLLRTELDAPFRSLGGDPSVGQMLSHQLAVELQHARRQDSRGTSFAPDQIALSLHPADVRTLLSSNPQVQDELARALRKAVTAAGLSLARPPHVTLSSDPTLGIGSVRVIVWHSQDPLNITPTDLPPAEELSDAPPGAFLIVDGKRHYPLDKPLVTLGRKLDNHLVLADPHVSRRHAEIRLQGGRFVLRDLNSTAGTRVNGQLIHEHSLQPGDVIAIAGSSLIYAEDPGGPPGASAPYSPPPVRKAGDHITPLDLRRPSAGITQPQQGGSRGK
ncbi:MAG TPA: FhaA domain-containing protein [Anaerolineales bacterium]|nr:FhaA domain-containing protein [Anaerolineales bacterium]